MKLAGVAAFVTGGARGIGRAICEALLKEGAKVCFIDIDHNIGEKTENELKELFPKNDVIFMQGDVRERDGFTESYNKAQETLGKIQIMVNNAGILSESNWSNMIDVNFKGVVTGTYVALEKMRKDKGGGGGVIINMASLAGLLRVGSVPVYAATKAAVVSFTLSWAEDEHFQEHGVRLNAICPKIVNTEMAAGAFSEAYHSEAYKTMFEAEPLIPTSRIADAVLQLIQNEEDNGKILVVTPKGAHYHQEATVEGV